MPSNINPSRGFGVNPDALENQPREPRERDYEGYEQISPLAEATPDSIDELLDMINDSLVEGMPERITEEKLGPLVDAFRAEALKWTQEQLEKKPRQRKTKTVDVEY